MQTLKSLRHYSLLVLLVSKNVILVLCCLFNKSKEVQPFISHMLRTVISFCYSVGLDAKFYFKFAIDFTKSANHFASQFPHLWYLTAWRVFLFFILLLLPNNIFISFISFLYSSTPVLIAGVYLVQDGISEHRNWSQDYQHSHGKSTHLGMGDPG